MKHLPNELLYLLKVYNYIRHDIGLDRARSRAEDIREYIRNADYLDAYPTVKEYISEDKSIDDIITYIQRNERTYSLLGEWAQRETETILSKKGLDGSSLSYLGGLLVKKEDDDAYFLLPSKPCIENKIVLLGADLSEDIFCEKVLWLELYRTQDGMCLEAFDDNCNTSKISFSDFKVEKMFFSAAPLSEGCRTVYDSCVRMASVILEKHGYDPTLLCDEEKQLMPVIKFLTDASKESLHGEYAYQDLLFCEYGIEKGRSLLSAVAMCDSDKKRAALSRKTTRLLKSKKCAPLIERIASELKESQKDIPTSFA